MKQEDLKKEKRSFRNRLRSVEASLVNLESDQGKLKRNREAVEIIKKQIRRKIQRFEIEREAQEEEEIKFDQKQFELDNERKGLKKELEILRIKISNLSDVEDDDENL